MGGWVQVVNESSLILINGCLCCNASLYADFPESRGRVEVTSAVTNRGLLARAATPSTQVLRGVVQGRALLLRQALLFEGRRATAYMLRVVRRQGGLLPVRIVLLCPRL